MAGLDLVLWNSGGLCASTTTTPQKMGFFDKEFPNANFSVAAFVETHHKSEHDFPELIREYALTHHLVHTPTPLDYSHGGIIVLIDPQYELVQSEVLDPGRLLCLRITHSVTKHNYTITVYYGYNWGKTGVNKSKMLQVLDNFRQGVYPSQNNIVMGDFNFADLHIDKGKGMSPRDKMFTALWEDFKSDCNLQDPTVPSTRRRLFIPTWNRLEGVEVIGYTLTQRTPTMLHTLCITQSPLIMPTKSWHFPSRTSRLEVQDTGSLILVSFRTELMRP